MPVDTKWRRRGRDLAMSRDHLPGAGAALFAAAGGPPRYGLSEQLAEFGLGNVPAATRLPRAPEPWEPEGDIRLGDGADAGPPRRVTR